VEFCELVALALALDEESMTDFESQFQKNKGEQNRLLKLKFWVSVWRGGGGCEREPTGLISVAWKFLPLNILCFYPHPPSLPPIPTPLTPPGVQHGHGCLPGPAGRLAHLQRPAAGQTLRPPGEYYAPYINIS
jgi:hypothetical protein